MWPGVPFHVARRAISCDHACRPHGTGMPGNKFDRSVTNVIVGRNVRPPETPSSLVNDASEPRSGGQKHGRGGDKKSTYMIVPLPWEGWGWRKGVHAINIRNYGAQCAADDVR